MYRITRCYENITRGTHLQYVTAQSLNYNVYCEKMLYASVRFLYLIIFQSKLYFKFMIFIGTYVNMHMCTHANIEYRDRKLNFECIIRSTACYLTNLSKILKYKIKLKRN